MSQRTLTLRHLVDGILTDVTSAILADPTAAYGVKQTADNAVIIASGTAMTRQSVGYYTYTNALLDSGTAYTWYAKITSADGTIDYEPFTAPVVSSHYGSIAGIQSLLGPANAGVDVDINSDGNAGTIAAEYEQVLTEGDRKIDSMLLSSGITAPVISTAANYWMLQFAGDRYAAVAASRLRGQRQENGKPAEEYAIYLAEADEMMERYMAVALYPLVTTGATGPASDPVTLYPTYPTNVTWGGLGWRWAGW